jgi:rfaE bifunctional protein nucleotidyltransferase chain/domain
MKSKILHLRDLPALRRRTRRQGKTIAFANGCFDLLHVGHIRYLQGAKAAADLLVVGVNSDTSVRALKGASRPLMPLAERLEILAALDAVDYLVAFSGRRPARLIGILEPDVHCKGTDYTPADVPERAVVERHGGRVLIVGDPKDHSTTEFLAKMGLKKKGLRRPGPARRKC